LAWLETPSQLIETALYDRTYVRTYVFSELCSIFRYVIKRWLARCS